MYVVLCMYNVYGCYIFVRRQNERKLAAFGSKFYGKHCPMCMAIHQECPHGPLKIGGLSMRAFFVSSFKVITVAV